MERHDALQLVRTRNEFYHQSYHQILKVLILCGLVIVLLMGIIVYLVMNRTRPKYFAVTPSGQLTPVVTLSEPNLSPEVLLQWSKQAASAAYSYDFVNFRKELQAAANFFTPSGWKRYLYRLQQSRNIKAVEQYHYVVSGAVDPSGAQIVSSGLIKRDNRLFSSLAGRYAWQVRLPMTVTFENSERLSQQRLMVTMLVVRVPSIYSARGVAIARFNAKAISGGNNV